MQLQARSLKGSSQGPEGRQPGARFSKGSSQAHLTGSLRPSHQAQPGPPGAAQPAPDDQVQQAHERAVLKDLVQEGPGGAAAGVVWQQQA